MTDYLSYRFTNQCVHCGEPIELDVLADLTVWVARDGLDSCTRTFDGAPHAHNVR